MIARIAAVALAGVLVVSPAGATTLAPSHTELPNAVPVALTPVGAGLLLLTDHPESPGSPGVRGKLHARTGVVSGAVVHWTAPIDLSGAWQVYGDSVRTDTAPNGLTAIAWNGLDTSQVNPSDQAAVTAGKGRAVVIVVRAPNGVWQGPYSTGQMTTLTGITADAAGDIAVLGYDVAGHQKTLVRTPAGAWGIVRSVHLRLASIHLDGRGVVHGVIQHRARGGESTVGVTRLGPGATRWTRPRLVRPAGTRVRTVQLLVSDAGDETLVVGSDSPNWAHTGAGGATAYQVLQHVHRRFVRVWQRDGAQQLTAATGPDGRLQVLWVQDHQPDRRHRPTRFRLVTQQVAPKAGPTTTLVKGATYGKDSALRSVGSDSLFLGSGAGNSGVGALWVDAQSLHAWWNGAATVLPASPAPLPQAPLGAVGALSSAPVVAWVSSGAQDAQGAYATATSAVAELLP